MWQPVLMINGYLISVLGLAMLIPAAVDMSVNKTGWSLFINSSLISIFIGVSLFLANRKTIKKITLQQGYLITVVSWVSMTLLATMPFLFYGTVSGFTDAWFEAMSGFTTTGATIMKDVEILPKPILLWRSMLSGLGGIGIVIFAVALLPFLGIGGMQIFQRENSDINDKFMPKFNYIAKRILAVYFFLAMLCAFSLHFAGMNWFDAVNHTLTTIATGGFSTKNTSIGYYHSVGIEMVIALFMFLGALPMTFYIMVMQNKDLKSFRTEQVTFFIKVLSVYILFMTCWLAWNGKYDFFEALRYSVFNIISVVTSTGFASTDYMKWGVWAGAFFIMFALTGGCTGSTSGSIKMFRWQVVLAYVKKTLITATDPNRVVPIKVGSLTTSESVVSSVLVFMTAYFFSVVFLTIFVSMTGLDFETAFSAVIACMTNSGPGIGPIIGPSGNYSSLSDVAKYLLSFAMLLGRLELLTVLVLFTKNFWRN
ncbi:MAG: TrkH family potassium uptake protein [Alphaproteobacteria bacterium]|nr:TrkH family potassium uptake protein [Alphaproteobacteria bacterium]